jgi:hypothetical protein
MYQNLIIICSMSAAHIIFAAVIESPMFGVGN